MLKDMFRAALVVATVAGCRAVCTMPMPKWPMPPAVETVAPRPAKTGVPVAPEPPPMPAWQSQVVTPAVPSVQWQPPAVTWQPPQIVVREETKRPLRRVAAAVTDLGDALIGVVR